MFTKHTHECDGQGCTNFWLYSVTKVNRIFVSLRRPQVMILSSLLIKDLSLSLYPVSFKVSFEDLIKKQSDDATLRRLFPSVPGADAVVYCVGSKECFTIEVVQVHILSLFLWY